MKNCSGLLVSILIFTTHFSAIALAESRKVVSAPFGEYKAVALRNASDVASIADPKAAMAWLGQRVIFGENKLSWIDGITCKLWSVREADSPVITLEDPNLSDLVIPPLDSETSLGDKRINIPVDLICQDNGEQILGRFITIDARVLVTSVQNGTVNLILEQPLSESQIKKFQTQLKDMKFYEGEITGALDEATLKSIEFYAEYRGSKYRFFRTAITENLLDGLRVLDTANNDKKALSPAIRPIKTEVKCRIAPLASPPGTRSDEYIDKPFAFEREVDGDGVVDVVRLRESGGSDASSTNGTLVLSATGEVIELTRKVSSSSMLNIHVVPPALVGNNRAAARRLVEDALFSITCNEPDPSLARLMAADQLLVWREGMPTIPGNYTVYFPEAPIGLIPFVGAWGELGFGSGRPVAVWVEYLGGTHAPTKKDRMENTSLLDDGFEVLAMTPRYRVLGTRHGVVVIDVAKDQYAWIYVFRGGHKLRWKSIVYAAINGSEVTVIARIRDLDGEQTGSIIVNLYDEGYTESWAPPSPDTTAQQRPPD